MENTRKVTMDIALVGLTSAQGVSRKISGLGFRVNNRFPGCITWFFPYLAS